MKQDQFTWNWYHWELVNLSQWTILEPLYYSSFVFATLVNGVIGYKFCWLLPQSRSTSWTRISWYTNWAQISPDMSIRRSWSVLLSHPASGVRCEISDQRIRTCMTGQNSGCEIFGESGMLAGQNSPPGGMSYVAHRKGDRLRVQGRESHVAFF